MYIRKFLENHIDLIDQNNFTELYECWPTNATTGQLTTVLLDCGINPLEYMTTVPNLYAYSTDIQSVEIPVSIDRIGESAFDSCKRLTSITIPNSVTSMGYYAFRDCPNLTSVTVGNGVTSISDGAFKYCINLTSVIISDSVTSIDSYAFAYCRSLTSITIPNSVTKIGTNAFYGCNKLVQITYNGTQAEWRRIQRADTSDLQHIKIQCIDGVIHT